MQLYTHSDNNNNNYNNNNAGRRIGGTIMRRFFAGQMGFKKGGDQDIWCFMVLGVGQLGIVIWESGGRRVKCYFWVAQQTSRGDG